MLINRRSMIQTSAAIATALSVRTVSRGAVQSPTKMKLGLVTYLWGQDMDLPTLLTSCEEAGVLGVELRTKHKHGVEPELNKAEREEVRKRFADSPVELVGYGSNCEFHSDDPAAVKKNIEQSKQYIQLMHDCGGTGLKVKPNGFPKGLTREQTIEQIGKSLNEVAAYGQELGQKIRVEVHGYETAELPVIRDIFAIADHPNVFVCWNCNDEDLHDEGLEANFNLVKDRFGDTVHVREFDVGEYPYPQLMKLFTSIDYEGWILLECRTKPEDKVAAMKEQRRIFLELVGQRPS